MNANLVEVEGTLGCRFRRRPRQTAVDLHGQTAAAFIDYFKLPMAVASSLIRPGTAEGRC